MSTTTPLLSRPALLPLALLLGALVWPAPAHAAKVWVEDSYGNESTAILRYEAPPGEDNHVTAEIGFLNQEQNQLWLVIVDSHAPLEPGTLCNNGGITGTGRVECVLHPPEKSTGERGSGWRDLIRADLGDGSNSFEGSAVYRVNGRAVDMDVISGDGPDQITTASGEDEIDPGAGSDVVHSGQGFDRIEATPAPDGPDTYDSGGSEDELSYALRTSRVELDGSTAGADGEGDTLVGSFQVVGGSADDTLAGSAEDHVLEGGPGNDTLVAVGSEKNFLYGGPGDDRLSTAGAGADTVNHLVGEEGNDSYYGGRGSDVIRESEVHQIEELPQPEAHPEVQPKPLPTPGIHPVPARAARALYSPEPVLSPDPSGGNDVAFGGGGSDYFELKAGSDLAYGGSGKDALHGGVGSDRLVAGPGDDFVIGGSGRDHLFGGSGHDRLFSGRWPWRAGVNPTALPFFPVNDDGRDSVNCGADRDQAFANPWDRLRGCERVHLRPHPKRRRR